MDLIKEAFQKIKQDINNLEEETSHINNGLSETRNGLIDICEVIKELGEKIEQINEKFDNFIKKDTSTHKPQNQTLSTHPSTDNTHLEALKPQNMHISTGNRGVPTDRQTHQQTDRHTQISVKNSINLPQNTIDNAVEILDSLDSIKKEIRLKFKRLTEQEMAIFSTLYQLEEEQGYADYKLLSQRLNLTESSIRDYVGRLVKKGIPVDKKRINNKNIHLFISQNLKKIATLSTILQLRDI